VEGGGVVKADFYHYHKLKTEEEKRVYMAYYRGLVKRQEIIDCGVFSVVDIGRIQEAIINDHPTLFYFRGCALEMYVNHMRIRPNYVMDEAQIVKYQKQLAQVANSFMRQANLTGKEDAYILEKVHDMLVEKLDYDFDALGTLSENHLQFAHSMLGVLIKKEAVCDGISKTYKFLLNHVGVSCIVITGCSEQTKNSKQPTHAWNVVKRGPGREKLHVDVTWDANGSKPGHVRRDYFLLTEQEIRKTHFNFEV